MYPDFNKQTFVVQNPLGAATAIVIVSHEKVFGGKKFLKVRVDKGPCFRDHLFLSSQQTHNTSSESLDGKL